MNGRVSYFTIGLFVSVAILAFAAMGLWLAGGTGGQALMRYSIIFNEDVSGLMLGGQVRYLGVSVGQIADIQLITGDEIRVRIDIEIDAATPVDSGTFASLAYQGITGLALINLASEPGDHTPLAKLPGNEYPVITLKNTGLFAVFADAPEISKSLSQVLIRVNALLDADNRDAFSSSLNNIESLTAALSTREDEIAALPTELNNVLAQIQDTLTQMQSVLAEVQPGIAPIVDNMNKTTENLANLSARLDGWLANNEAELEMFTKDGLSKLPKMISDTRNAVRELEKLFRELRDNPSSLLYKPQNDPTVMDQETH